MHKNVQETFGKVFGNGSGTQIFFAPGRVNLIGEHTDYNGGHVLPCALTLGTYAVVKKRQDMKLRLYSINFPNQGVIETSIDALAYHPAHDWGNYPKGMIKTLMDAGYAVSSGLDIVFGGNIPNGAGLSSSASIELVTGVIVETLFNLSIPRVELVSIAKRAENQFIGVNCGIMDQFVIGMGQKNHALLLNTSSLEYDFVPLTLKDHVLVIANSNKSRGLADSQYNQRTRECSEALEILGPIAGIKSLCQMTPQAFQNDGDAIENPTVYRRARHVITENARTLEACKALTQGDIKYFGELMNLSHRSLKEDYEVTGKELDTLVALAWAYPGVVGSRMTGAGFGGCTISLVHKEVASGFVEEVGKKYLEQIGYGADFYIVEAGDGAGIYQTI